MGQGQQFLRVARRTALAYALVAGAWILFSDGALLLLGLEATALATISKFKGLAFVLFTATLLYIALSRQLRQLMQAHEALAAAEARYRDLVDSLPYGILEFDGNGRIRFANQAATHVLGRSAERLNGRRLTCLADPSSDSVRLTSAQARTGSGTAAAISSGEMQLLRGDGESVRIHLDWIPHRTDGGGEGHLGVLTDVTDLRRHEAARQRLSAVVEATPDLVLMLDLGGRLLDTNSAGRVRLGLPSDVRFETSTMARVMPAWAWRRLKEEAFPAASSSGSWSGENAFLDADGREFPVSQVMIAHRDKAGRIGYFSTIVRDISDQKRAAQALRNSREQYRSLVENANEGLVVAQHGAVRYANPRMLQLQGYSLQEYLTRPWLEFVCPDDRDAVLDWYRRQANGDVVAMPYSFRLVHKDGGKRWVEASTASILWEGERATLTFFTDVTEQVEAQFRLDYLADYDELTGLPNRRLFLGRLAHQLNSARRTGELIAVLYLDLNRMRLINDSHGHEVGDRLIQAVAERLSRVQSERKLMARISSDEFALVLRESDGSSATLQEKIGRVLEAVGHPIEVDGQELFISASAGVSVFPADGDDASDLLRNAASALELARRLGPGSYQFYSERLDRKAAERLRLESDLRHALERDEFELYYQPQADMRSGSIVGAEALLRWNRGGEAVLPGAFISVLEEMNFIWEVGAWVLETACRQLQRWDQEGRGDLRLSVNLSARQVNDPRLPDTVAQILRETHADAKRIELEITESSLVSDPASAAETLEHLCALGFSIAIDDFGTGYSSLAYFRRFPVTVLKIDKSFVAGIGEDDSSAEIARAICAMGHSLGAEVVAEGVETPAQLDVLRSYDCDRVQGYLLAPALPIVEFERWIDDGICLPTATPSPSSSAAR